MVDDLCTLSLACDRRLRASGVRCVPMCAGVRFVQDHLTGARVRWFSIGVQCLSRVTGVFARAVCGRECAGVCGREFRAISLDGCSRQVIRDRCIVSLAREPHTTNVGVPENDELLVSSVRGLFLAECAAGKLNFHISCNSCRVAEQCELKTV